MKKTEIENIKQTIEWLLHNGDFKDTETAYNSAMNSINTLEEAINFTDSSSQLNDKEVEHFQIYVDYNFEVKGDKYISKTSEKAYSFEQVALEFKRQYK